MDGNDIQMTAVRHILDNVTKPPRDSSGNQDPPDGILIPNCPSMFEAPPFPKVSTLILHKQRLDLSPKIKINKN
jgi:hypothetical protein